MIRIPVELIPGSDESRARELGRAEVANIDAMPRFQHSDYAWRVSEGDNKCASTKAWSRSGTLLEQPKRASVWNLVAAVARAAVEGDRLKSAAAGVPGKDFAAAGQTLQREEP
jgi:hypothetical protein